MFAPRSFMDENAMVSQTPGPRRARMGALSPTKGHLTTAGKPKKAALDENQFASPKRLFGDAKSPQKGGATPGPSRRPMKGSPTKAGPSGASNALRAALGDKTNNNNKTPALRTGRPGRASPTDGSPQKKSPVKGKKPITGKVPITPGALQLPKPSAFRTPVASLGQRAMLRQRTSVGMGSQRLRSVAPVDAETADAGAEVTHWTDGLTHAEIYPEAEYMPPSHLTRQQQYDPPPELEGLMDAGELADRMRSPRFISAWGLSDHQQTLAMPELSMTFPSDKDLAESRQAIVDSLPVIQPKIAEDELSPSQQQPRQTQVKRNTATSSSTSSAGTTHAGPRKTIAPVGRQGSSSKMTTTSRVRATPTSAPTASSRPSSVKSTASAPVARSRITTAVRPSSTRLASTTTQQTSKSTKATSAISASKTRPQRPPASSVVEKDELDVLLEEQIALAKAQDELDLGQDL